MPNHKSDNMTFSNTSIDVHQLPTVQQGKFVQLEPGYQKVILIQNSITSVLLIGLVVVLYFTDALSEMGNYQWVLGATIVLFSGFLFWFRPKAFSRKGYQLRERDIVFRTGLWWQEETVIPFVRVQHSEVTQGPLGRIYGYSKLKLYTAGGSKSDLSIPALDMETARRLEQFVTQKTGQDADI